MRTARSTALAGVALVSCGVAAVLALDAVRSLAALRGDEGPTLRVEPTTAGWTRWTGAGERCPLWLPDSPAALPPPPSWAPCDALGPGVRGCRSLVLDWTPGDPPALGAAPSMAVDADGRALVSYNKLAIRAGDPGSYKQWVVAYVDGPVLAAVVQPWTTAPACTLVESGVGEGVAAWSVRATGSPAEAPAGAGARAAIDALLVAPLGGDHAAPRVVVRDATATVSTWAVGAAAAVRSISPARRAELYDPDGRLRRVLHDPAADPDHLPLAGNPVRVQGADVLFEVGDARERAIMAYDPDGGVMPLVRFPAGSGRGAGNLGSDGQILVWTQGEGPLGDGRYRETTIQAAPYTTRAAALEPHRVAIDPNPLIGAAPFVVGCGRAAHAMRGGAAVVELATGRVSTLPPPPSGVSWGRPLALTCEELFITYFVGARAGIARLSLGQA
ncbi:MAG TPA: hypothetical protein VFT22_21295 [Kofleriaceae bacterium]|nr:hypothetical protein [Kofleriaceae bacterium]